MKTRLLATMIMLSPLALIGAPRMTRPGDRPVLNDTQIPPPICPSNTGCKDDKGNLIRSASFIPPPICPSNTGCKDEKGSLIRSVSLIPPPLCPSNTGCKGENDYLISEWGSAINLRYRSL